MDADRIEQFRKMAQADPDNELGHFSLGKALIDAGQYDQAIEPLEKVIELNNQFSKAYHLLALAQKEANQTADAVSTLRIGYDIATSRGDLMPKKEMAKLLTELGQNVPEDHAGGAPTADVNVPLGEGQIIDSRTGQPGTKMPKPPFKGPLGEKIYEKVSMESWREWLSMGTKVINELRLDLSDPADQEAYDRHMKEFLNVE